MSNKGLRYTLNRQGLQSALLKIGDIKSIIKGNQYEKYMVQSLDMVKGELIRQLTNLENQSRIEWISI